MAQQVRVLAALPENPDSTPAPTHQLTAVTPGPRSHTLGVGADTQLGTYS